MSVALKTSAKIVQGAQTVSLATLFGVTASSSNPAYLVLTGLDRDEYTAGESGATGSLTGNGKSDAFSGIGGDARGIGIVFTYQPSTGQYYNATYGDFSQIQYTSSASAGDVTNLSLFGTSSAGLASLYADNPFNLMQDVAGGFIGSATIATEPGFVASAPSQATPDSIAAVAMSFVGDAWNDEGCWVLASTIAAEAGASLPVQSSAIGVPGVANGEWFVAYNGPAGAGSSSGNWESMVTEGDVVVIGTAGGGGHITTCVSGAGVSAMLVDNIAYENSAGQIVNPANDGSANDVLVSAPHSAMQEWSGVAADTVVIYRLDTPIVTDLASSTELLEKSTEALAKLASAADPMGKAITEYQVYDTNLADGILDGGVLDAAHSAAAAASATSLTALSLATGTTPGADTVEIRAFNGTYWGDWQSLAVFVAPPAAPVVASATPAQSWTIGQTVKLALPAATFTDPQGEALVYAAAQSNGQALPAWLSFNAATDTFGGTAPASAQTLTLSVTATDTSGLSVSDSFKVTIAPPSPPVVVQAEAAQVWKEGQSVTLAIPAKSFGDPQGEALTYSAIQSDGQPLPSWLSFNKTTDTFSGTAPITPETLGIKITATDTSGLSVSQTFQASVVPAGPVLTDQTQNMVFIDGSKESIQIATNTFTDPFGAAFTLSAEELSGPNVTSWLRFNGTTGVFSGNVPNTASGPVKIEVIATDANHLSASETFTITFGSATGHFFSAAPSAGATGFFALG